MSPSRLEESGVHRLLLGRWAIGEKHVSESFAKVPLRRLVARRETGRG
jgi:hypothetical protein